MTRDIHAIVDEAPSWNEVVMKTKTLIDMDTAYRASSKKTGALRDTLQDELKSRLEEKHKNLLADSPELTIAISFRFGKTSYALVPKKAVKRSKNSVNI